MRCIKVGLIFVSLLTALTPASWARTIRIQPTNEVAILEALAQLPETGGEIILFDLTTPVVIRSAIVIDRDNVTLAGEGKVVLRLADAANAPVIILGQSRAVPTATHTNIHLRNLVIDGNRERQTSEFNAANPELRNNGISIRRVTDCSIEGVTSLANRSGGLVTELGCRRILVKDFESYNNHFDAVACYETEESTFTKMNLHDNHAAGISLDIDFIGNVISDSLLSSNRSVGIFMRDARNNMFNNLEISDSGEHGIFVAQADLDPETCATGNKFKSCTITNSGGAGIRVNDATCVNNVFTGTQFKKNAKGDISECVTGLAKSDDLAVK